MLRRSLWERPLLASARAISIEGRTMLAKFGKLLGQGYSLLLAAACGGFLGANLAAFVPAIGEFFFNSQQRATPPETFRRWMDGGWLVGAGFALVAALVEIRRRRAKQLASRKQGHETSAQGREHYPRPRTVLGSMVAGAAGFGLLGAILGATLLLFWFSLVYSPFSPAGWGASVNLEVDRTSFPSQSPTRGRIMHTTNHPVALYLFFVPVLVGAGGGALFCGAAKLVEKVNHE
jgi:hypothetical protein